MQRRQFLKFSSVGLGVALAAPAAIASDAHAPVNAGALKATADKMYAEIIKNNEFYTKQKGAAFFEAFKNSQAPRATIIGCSDSRFQENILDASPENDLFVIRNIGNQYTSNEGSVSYGVTHLHTPLLMVVGHTRCGAIKAALSDYTGEDATIRKEVDTLSLSIRKAVLKGDANEQWAQAVASNVNQQVEYCKAKFGKEVASGQLTIVGVIYDLANDLGKGYGRVIAINVNGEKDPAKLASMPIIQAAAK